MTVFKGGKSVRSLLITGLQNLSNKGLSREAGQKQLFILAVTSERHGGSAAHIVVNNEEI